MNKKILIFVSILISAVLLDQYTKNIFVNGFVKHFDCMSFFLVYNKGVAFSMFSNFGDYIKYIQIASVSALIIYLIYEKTMIKEDYIPWAFIVGGGVGNIIDRFNHIGVVDFIYWHCGFNFAIFNLADIFINIGVFLLLLSFFIKYKNSKKANNEQ